MKNLLLQSGFKISGPWQVSPSAKQSWSDDQQKVYEDNRDALNKIKKSIQHGYRQGSGLLPYLCDMQNPSSVLRVGILGGGQLGRMLLQAAANYPVETWIMENDPECPAAHLCHHFTKGDIKNFDDVYQFGKGLDAITIEIENVNVEALEQLEKEGVKVFPKPSVLRIIRNKILQKQYYQQYQIPTAPFVITENLEALKKQESFLPAVHKLGTGGYDGRGVQIIQTKEEIAKVFDQPSVI